MVCKEEGDRFFRKPVLVLGFHPYLSPYVVHLCCAFMLCIVCGGGLADVGGRTPLCKGGGSRFAECMIHAPWMKSKI